MNQPASGSRRTMADKLQIYADKDREPTRVPPPLPYSLPPCPFRQSPPVRCAHRLRSGLSRFIFHPFDALNACSGQAFHLSPLNSHPLTFATLRLCVRFFSSSFCVSLCLFAAIPLCAFVALCEVLFASIRGCYSCQFAVTPSIAKLSIYFDDCCCNGLSFWNSGEDRHRSASARLGNSIITTR